MSLFSSVSVFCNICGQPFMTNFQRYEGRVCSDDCNEEYNMRRATAILGVSDEKRQQPYKKPLTNSIE
mgnify:FL=1